MTELDDDTQLTLLAPGRWRGEITDRWSVRAPNGGYLATYLTRALMEVSPAPDPIALNVHYVAPARPGDAVFEADVVRAGRSHATLAARLFQGDDVVAVGLATGAGEGTMTAGGWKRLVDRELDDLAVPLFMDSWPPSVWGVSERGGILPTVEMTFHWRARPTRPWHLLWFTTSDVRDGYFVENGGLWGDDGVLVAQSRQIARFVEEGPTTPE
jgi:hypothetical protein